MDREKMRSSGWFLLVGDRKGVWRQNFASSPCFSPWHAEQRATVVDDEDTCLMAIFQDGFG